MRETIAYNKNFKEGSYIEKLKFKPEGFKNKVTALLYDQAGNLVQEGYTENIIHTSNLDFTNFVNTYGPVINNANGSTYSINAYVPSNKLILTDYAGTENANNLFLRGNIVGWAKKSGSVVTPTTTQGYMNTAESKKLTTHKYKYVFDFPQTCANGTFQSLWFADKLEEVQGLFTHRYMQTDNNSNVNGMMFCESDGYWMLDPSTRSIKKYDYASGTIINTINLSQAKVTYNDYNYDVSNYSVGPLMHMCLTGEVYLYISSITSSYIFKINPATNTGYAIKTPFSVFSTTYIGDNIYWIGVSNGTYGLYKMKISDFEACTDFTKVSSDLITVKNLVNDIIKPLYPSGGSISVLSPMYHHKLSEYDGTLFLSGYFSANGFSMTSVLINPTTLEPLRIFSQNITAYDNGLIFSNDGNNASGAICSGTQTLIAKWLNSGTVITTSGWLCTIIPPLSHAKLPAPITKDSSQSLKIIYEFEIQLPNGYLGTIKSRV